jgi:hypothetical protein
MELLFVISTLGVGAGLALSLGKSHGVIAAILGFVGGVTSMFILLGLVLAIAKRFGCNHGMKAEKKK